VAVVNEMEAPIKRQDERRLSRRLLWTCLNIFVRVREREFSTTWCSVVALLCTSRVQESGEASW